MARKMICALLVAGMAFGAAACNTVQGVGRDIESVGKAGERVL